MRKAKRFKLFKIFFITALVIISLTLVSKVIVESPGTAFAYSSDMVYQSDSSPPPSAPDLRFDHISTDDGLAENIIFNMIKASDGYLWIASELALHRYDGYSFNIYSHDQEDETSILKGVYWDLAEDKNGNIWIGSDFGLGMYDKEMDEFVHYVYDANNENSISGNRVSTIFEDSTGTIWVGTRNSGLNSFSPEEGIFTWYKNSPGVNDSISSDQITSIVEDQEGNIWIGTDGGGLNKLDKSTGKFTHFINDPSSLENSGSNFIESLYQDSNNLIWVGSRDNGLLLFNPEKETLINDELMQINANILKHVIVKTFNQDNEGTLWVGTLSDGLFLINRSTGLFAQYTYDPDDPYSLSQNHLTSIVFDDSGMVWITTDNGINIYDKYRYKFSGNISIPSDQSIMVGPMVWAIDDDEKGNLYLGTFGHGLGYYDFITGSYTRHLFNPENENSLSSDNIQSMIVDSNGLVWAGTVGGGLSMFDPTTKNFTNYRHDPLDPDSISQNSIWGLYEDSDGYIWVGTYDYGLNRLNTETGVFTHFFHDPEDSKSISSNAITYVFEDSLGTLWVGTKAGLNILDRETGHFSKIANDQNGVGKAFVANIAEDSETNLWIGTIDGLYKFNRDDETTQYFSKSDGLPDNTIAAIVISQDGILWMSTFNGVSRYDPKDNSYLNYSEKDGIPTKALNVGNYIAEDGQIYFGNVDGFFTFHPDDIIANPFIPQIVITDFLLNNKTVKVGSDTVLPKAISELDEVTLDYTDTVFSIEFSALHYSNPKSNQYAYMLEGFDEDWVYTSSDRRYVTYTNLDGGEYVFRVKGSSSDGVWNEEGRTLKITIIPPFWETMWFRALIAALLTGFVVFAVRMRIRTSEQRRKELEVIVAETREELHEAQDEIVHQERLAVLGRLAGSVSHELRNPLGVISNSIYYLKNARQDLDDDALDKYFDIIEFESEISVKIITDLLNYGKDEEPIIRKIKISELISETLSKTPPPEDPELEVKVEITPEGLSAQCDHEQLEIAIANILDNAYQVMENGGTLTISAHKEKEEVLIEISDTGEGIPEEDKEKIFQPLFSTKIRGFGLGLSVTKKYIEANNGRIEFASEKDVGTTFKVYLPRN